MKKVLTWIFATREGVIRSGWSIGLCVAAIVISQILVGVFAGIVMMIQHIAAGGAIDPGALMDAASDIASMPLITYITYTLNIAVLLGMWKLLYRKPLRHMGLSARNGVYNMVYGLLFGIASIGLVFVSLVVTGNSTVQSVNAGILLAPAFWGDLLMFIFVGFFEELLSRGYMMSALKTTRNKYVILALPAVIFGLLHIMNPNVGVLPIANIALVGFLFAYMFIKTGDLWMPIGFHITWNFFQGNIFGYQVSGTNAVALLNTADTGSSWVTGGAFGPEGGVVVTLITIVGILWVRFMMKPRKHEAFWRMRDDGGTPPAIEDGQEGAHPYENGDARPI